MKRRLAPPKDRTLQLLTLLADLAAQAQRNARLTHALLGAVVTTLTGQDRPRASEPPGGQGAGNSHTSERTHEDFMKDVLLDELKDALGSENANWFNEQCNKFLEGMGDAVRAGDNRGAARAYLNYVRCMTRPRPKVVVPVA